MRGFAYRDGNALQKKKKKRKEGKKVFQPRSGSVERINRGSITRKRRHGGGNG